MSQAASKRSAAQANTIPWAMQMRATSLCEPGRLVHSVTGAILGCDGWVLSRGATDSGLVNILFEFKRSKCIEIYSMLIAAGVELSRSGHMVFTELCQCTRMNPTECGIEITSIDLEIQTLPAEQAAATKTQCRA